MLSNVSSTNGPVDPDDRLPDASDEDAALLHLVVQAASFDSPRPGFSPEATIILMEFLSQESDFA